MAAAEPTGWPSTTSPVTFDEAVSIVAPEAPAATVDRRARLSTVTSPPKKEMPSALTIASALDDVPGAALTLALEVPIRSAVPSAPKVTGPPAVASGGADADAEAITGCPGTVNRATRPAAVASGPAGAAVAEAAMTTHATVIAAEATKRRRLVDVKVDDGRVDGEGIRPLTVRPPFAGRARRAGRR